MEDLIRQAGDISRARHGDAVGFHVPGMFFYDGRQGRFPALSVTGAQCDLNCGHCAGRLLGPMIDASDPETLVKRAEAVARNGAQGILISGGCDSSGRLPWERFVKAVAWIKDRTNLTVAVHAGFVQKTQAEALKRAGVDTAMFDVIGDEATLREIYGLEGATRVADSLSALVAAGLRVAPHVVVGLHAGRLRGEEHAVEMIAAAGCSAVVFVVFMPLPNTPLADAPPPPVEEVVGLIARTRIRYPDLVQHLGCAKPRGAYRRRLDRAALRAGVNHLAIPAPEAVDLAPNLGREVFWTETCCAVDHHGAMTIKDEPWTARTTCA
ncbi:MAG: radical SAM protein [Proteobacteria bacterium]|nr:radical SAM protein [Pseudomonadota bacterium]